MLARQHDTSRSAPKSRRILNNWCQEEEEEGSHRRRGVGRAIIETASMINDEKEPIEDSDGRRESDDEGAMVRHYGTKEERRWIIFECAAERGRSSWA